MSQWISIRLVEKTRPKHGGQWAKPRSFEKYRGTMLSEDLSVSNLLAFEASFNAYVRTNPGMSMEIKRSQLVNRGLKGTALQIVSLEIPNFDNLSAEEILKQ